MTAANVPEPVNEPVRGYAPGSAERTSLLTRLHAMSGEAPELPLVIGGRDVTPGALVDAVAPHAHAHVVGRVHQGGAAETEAAIEAAAAAWPQWSRTPLVERAAIFLRAADLLAGPWRDTLNAATMLGQSKTVQQAEIDAACELVDFLRFNVHFAERIEREQPISSPGVWNQLEYRPLEGFVLAVTPFNFTAIGGNLPAAPALMGNTVVWKPSSLAPLSAHYVQRLLEAAGLPAGVINLVHGPPAEIVGRAVADPRLAGIHFTGSTEVFQSIWHDVGSRLASYRSYPRLVGETGGKDFVLVHESADLDAAATALVRGAFEYQGQKCSAASRAFVPERLWPELRDRLAAAVDEITTGDVADLSHFMGAVIDVRAFRRLRDAIAEAESSPAARVVAGGRTDDAVGWFVEPTVVETDDPGFRLLRDELFGPLLTVLPYRDWDEVLGIVDAGAPYALTGAVLARDRAAIAQASDRLRDVAGNFYVNDKPTGAVVGQQPFGGARASGTNDKAGSLWNLARWTSPRTIKETFVPPTEWRYPYMG